MLRFLHLGLETAGYNVCDNGFKLPLMYLVMFIPLLLSGLGKLSLDHLLARRFMTH